MKTQNRLFAIFTVIAMLFSCVCIVPDAGVSQLRASAASVDYPVQLMRIGLSDNSKNLNISGYTDNSQVIASDSNGSQNQNWRFDYVGSNSNGSFFKIANMGCGRLLTPQGYSVTENTAVVTYGSESHTSQHWYIIPVDKDSFGDALTYKIVNYDAPDLALTISSGKAVLAKYSGKSEQKFLLNSAGIQGFGGYCKDMNGKAKSSVTGGVMGETVEVSTFDELKKACTDTAPKTIIITKNISGKSGSSNYTISTGYDNGRRYVCKDNYIYLQPNKTIIGSYGANTLYNVYFRTYDENWGPGYNIIIRNINCTHDTELNSDNIWEFAYGRNFWIDHCNFVGHDKIETSSLKSEDWDKFLNFKGTTDYATISDCTFGHHEYGVLMGYPTDDEATYKAYNGRPCITLATNYYKNTVTRAPGLMRYGYYHSLNNYVDTFSMGYTVHTACKLYAEACYFANGGNVFCDWNKVTYPGSYADANSKYVSCQRTKKGDATATNPSYSTDCTWRPTTNYTYKALTADNAKNWCTKYSGVQSSASNMSYSVFDKTGMPSAGYTVTPDEPGQPTTEPTTSPSDTVKVVGAVNGDYLDSSWLTAGELTSAIKVNDTYSITASAEKTVNIYSQENTTADGKHKVTSSIALGGAGNTAQRSIQVNAISKGMLEIYMASSNPEAPRTVNLLDGSGNIIQTVENVVGDKINSYSFNIPAKGTYYITSASSGLNIYYAQIYYASAPATVKGDANADGQFNVADIVMLGKWLIHSGELTDWQACDLCEDGVIDAFDLVMMRKLIVSGNEPPVEVSSYEPADFKFSGKVYLVGDSTVCDYDANTMTSLDRSGWGTKLADQYNGVTVTNLALSGRSSRSFLEEKNYQTLCSSIGKGDYLFIQFGHNDEKTDESTYPGLGTYPGLDMASLDNSGKNSSGQYSYEWIILNKYIKIAQSRGAVPVIVTPITRRASDGTANYQGHTKYQEALIELGKQNNVAVIDMTTLTTQLYTNLYNYGGADETAKMHCYTDAQHTSLDNTHLSNAGANKIANMIAEQTEKLGLTIGNNKK